MSLVTSLKTLVAVLLFASCAAIAGEDPNSEVDQAKRKDIERLLEVTHGLANSQQMMDQIIGILERAHPEVPARVWGELRQGFDVHEIAPVMIGIYDRHFTREDVEGLIKFYESPLGEKLVASQPEVMRESLAAGQIWGAKVLERLQATLKERGYSS